MIPFSFNNRPNVFEVLILLYLIPLFFVSSSSIQINNEPVPSVRTSIDQQSQFLVTSVSIPAPMPVNPQKQLRRLPHVFSQVLELPFRSHADVLIDDRSDCFRFTANVTDHAFGGQVRAFSVNIHPGVMKVVVRGGDDGAEEEMLLDKLELDVWRFRLPETTRPELATATVVGRELIVTVPKGRRSRSGRRGKVEDGGGRGRPIHVH